MVVLGWLLTGIGAILLAVPACSWLISAAHSDIPPILVNLGRLSVGVVLLIVGSVILSRGRRGS